MVNENNGELDKPMYGSYISKPLNFSIESLSKVFQNPSLIGSGSFKSTGELITRLNQDWSMILKNYFFYLSALKRLGKLSAYGMPYDIKTTLLEPSQGYLYLPGIGNAVLPVYTTGKALGNVLFGMNMSSVADMSWSSKTTVWLNAMSRVGAYNENTKPGAHIKDRFYQGEHPYSGSYIFLGYWKLDRSSY